MQHLETAYDLRVGVLAALLVLSIAPPGIAAAPPPDGPLPGDAHGAAASSQLVVPLLCIILDASSGDTVAARCSVIDRDGLPRHPPVGESFYHTAGGGFFYTKGTFTVLVPPGSVIVRASRGPEYEPAVRSLVVSEATSVCITLDRIVDMADFGFYGGDAHVHINHSGGYYILDPEDALMMASAEGLSVVNCLDDDYYFTGKPDPCSTAQCIVYMSEELRSFVYGDAALLGLSRLIKPAWVAWWPLIGVVADSAHAQGGTCVIAAHPVTTDDFSDIRNWPGVGLARELPVDVTRDRIDCFDVMSYSNCHGGGIELELWYRFLNCGFELPASAGTDACLNRIDNYPPGDFRVYAYIPSRILSYEDWILGLASGRSFITSGPLITRFSISGAESGGTIYLGRGSGSLPCTLSVVSASPIVRAELVLNGAVEWSAAPAGLPCALDTSFAVTIDRSVWIAARVYSVNEHWFHARDTLVAHTSPIYLSMEGKRVVEPEAGAYFVDWITKLEELAREEGSWAQPIDSIRAFDEFAAAKVYYSMVAHLLTGDEGHAGVPVPAPSLGSGVPNPFSSGTTIGFCVPPAEAECGAAALNGRGAPVEISVYDVRGRLIQRLIRGGVEAGRGSVYWDGTDGGGVRVPSGVYFCRLRCGARSWSTKLILVR